MDDVSPSTGLVAWWDEPAPGPDNMAADEELAAEAAATGSVLVRLYGWSEPTVSLGGFQRLADARACAVIAGLPLVRRPSGGGAIIHGSDLTYAVAVPRTHPWGGDPQVLYDAFHAALAAELRGRGLDAALHPGREPAAGDEARLLCFDRRARGDVVVRAADGDHKVLGSAQRRLRGVILQHGSLLLRSPAGRGGRGPHLGLAELAREAAGWNPRELAAAWLSRVATAARQPLTVRPEPFGPTRRAAIAARSGRFREPAWLARR